MTREAVEVTDSRVRSIVRLAHQRRSRGLTPADVREHYAYPTDEDARRVLDALAGRNLLVEWMGRYAAV